MKNVTLHSFSRTFVRAATAIAAAAVCASASAALPVFTFDPSAVGLAGPSFTADNLLISDYATVRVTETGFIESGYLVITGAQLGTTTFQPLNLTSDYGLYVAFNATGRNVEASQTFTRGTFDTLSYSLIGYNGPASFTPTSAPAAFVTLASGRLDTSMDSIFDSTARNGAVISANSSAFLTLDVARGEQGFFRSPSPFYGLAESAFNNTRSEIQTTGTGFTVTQGGGSINFVAAPVPEPETYALMLAGLGALGFAARRRAKV